jgi:hypothetical protein
MRPSVDLSALADPATPQFFEELSTAPALLHASDSSRFFEAVLAHFAHSRALSPRQGAAIFAAVHALLEKEYHRAAFAAGGHADALPYGDPRFLSDILTVFFKLVSLDAALISDRTAAAFAHLVPREPTKCLILLARYAKRFADLANPWGMLDLLIHHAKEFSTPELIADFVNLLCYLCYEFREYRAERVRHCWNEIAANLVSDDVATIRACYNGLCALVRFNPDGILHLEVLSLHLTSEETVESALSILTLRTLTVRSFASCPAFLPNLIGAATRTAHASVVLMEIAKSHNGALKVLEDPRWLLLPLPMLVDTINLFFVVFHHKSLRPKFLAIPQFLPFLRVLVGLKNPGILSVVAMVLHRIPLTQAHVSAISNFGLFREIASIANGLHDRVSIGAALLVAGAIGRFVFVKELTFFCDLIVDCFADGGALVKRAARLAGRLSKYPKCRAKLERGGVAAFFEEHGSEPDFQAAAERFRRTEAA